MTQFKRSIEESNKVSLYSEVTLKYIINSDVFFISEILDCIIVLRAILSKFTYNSREFYAIILITVEEIVTFNKFHQ